jgi:TetR/AcrR family tetracycline transcriptional repressor
MVSERGKSETVTAEADRVRAAPHRVARARRRGRPPKSNATGLDRSRVLEAALRHVDEHGLESLGMRNLAAELGVAPNSLYSYVAGKDDLVRGVVELALGTLEVPSPVGVSWTDRCREVCRCFRGQLLQHPNVVAASAFRRTFPFGFLPFNYALGEIVSDGGYEGRELVETMMVLFYHTIGFVTLEVARGERGMPTKSDAFVLERAEHGLGDSGMEVARELLPFVRTLGMDALFDTSLTALLDGLVARRSAPAKIEPRRGKPSGGKS